MSSGAIIYLITPLVAAVSQLMLKRAADDPQHTGIRFYVNTRVILAYVLFLGCMVMNVIALQTLALTVASVLEASGFLYVMVLGRLFLKEKLTPKKLVGNALIVAGIVITLIVK
ncbi:MAG: DMT family transporter [Eubacteriales bacterium]|nr:DMT family transporter [Eubacteriales bacterium]